MWVCLCRFEHNLFPRVRAVCPDLDSTNACDLQWIQWEVSIWICSISNYCLILRMTCLSFWSVFVWDTQRKFSDYWAIITELLQLLSVLTFHCNKVIFKLPSRRALQDLLKSNCGWTPKTTPNFVTPVMDFASNPFLLHPNSPEILDNITCICLCLKLATSHHNTCGNILLIKPLGNVTFPNKISAWQT